MSELNEQRWAVTAEDGFVASDLSYHAALVLQFLLAPATEHSTIITNEAAEREAKAAKLKVKLIPERGN